jgi:hypothetical protein
MRVAIDRLEAPAIEVVDVRVRNENCIDATCGTRAPRQQRIEDDAPRTEIRDGSGVAQPGNARTRGT